MRIYLAGPIAGLILKDALAWRDAAEAVLTEAGFDVLNPLRGIDISLKSKIVSKPVIDNPRRSDKAIVGRDLADINASDIVLFNFADAPAISIGSCVEIGFCHALRKFVIVVLDKKSSHDHPFIREAGPVFNSLDEAMEFLISSIPRHS